jgi:NADH-quinone oxidoreductase subunit F
MGEAFVALKASFRREQEATERAMGQMREAGLLGEMVIRLITGPEEYLFGEEKALLEVIEGNDPLPRWLPPYLHGLFATVPQLGWEAHDPEQGHVGAHYANPTLVNNVETLANVPHILAKGAGWFRSMGTGESPGTVVCTVVGDVRRPDVVEVELGTELGEVLDHCGGPLPGRRIRAVLSGVSNPVLTGEQVGTRLSYEDMVAAGSGLGAAGFVVYDDTACMVEVARMLSRFLYVESCGQCLPCKFGTGEITEALDRIATGQGSGADGGLIQERLKIVADANRCYLLSRSDASSRASWPPSPRTSPPTSKAPAPARERFLCPRSSTWRTAGWCTTSARPASAPTGPTTSRREPCSA